MSQRASNPIDKAVLYRLMRYNAHGIKAVLVFDGDRKPEKKGKKGYRTAVEYRPVLKEIAGSFKIPCWQAPAEAEAECARMQKLGLVDAVFSEDSDKFMFKGETVLRFRMEENHKSNIHVLMYRMSDIKDKTSGTRWDWKDLVLFAAVAGGDYVLRGLPGCGPRVAEDAAKQGYGASLVDAFKNNTHDERRLQFGEFLKDRGSKITIPKDFPNAIALKDYIEPRV